MRIERTWEAWETAYLVQNAHRAPLEEIAAHLGRSEHSVKAKAKRLRKAGRDVGPLRKCGTVPAICKSCGQPRYRMNRGGTCTTCAELERLKRIEAQARRIEAELTPAQVANLPGKSGPRKPMPPEPDPSDREAHEAWEEARAARRAKAAQKRLERMRAAIGNM